MEELDKCRCGYSNREIFDQLCAVRMKVERQDVREAIAERDKAIEYAQDCERKLKALESMSVLNDFKIMRESLEKIQVRLGLL